MKKITLMLMVLFLFSCNNENKEYQEAKKVNTIEAYDAFISMHNEGIYSDSAKLMIKEIQRVEFDNVKLVNKLNEYEKYLLKYPSSIYTDTIKNVIYKMNYNTAKSSGNIDSIKEYMVQYPESPFLEDCEKEIIQLDQRAKQLKEREKQLKYESSDKGIRSKVLALINDNCLKEYAKLTVKNGHVQISTNCIKTSRECFCGTSINPNRSRIMSGRRKCRKIIFGLKERVNKLPGVKSVVVTDLSD